MITLEKVNKFGRLSKRIFLIFVIIFLFGNTRNISFSKNEKLQNINYDILESQKDSLDVQSLPPLMLQTSRHTVLLIILNILLTVNMVRHQ